jgi:hypothetical protein
MWAAYATLKLWDPAIQADLQAIKNWRATT